MADFNDEELFTSALGDDLPAEVVEETTETEGETQARDEQGRFVAKTEEAEPVVTEPEQAKPVEAKDDAQIPSWRLRELREERDALRAQLLQVQQRQTKTPPEPVAKPDIFEKPDEFVLANIQEVVVPLQQRFDTFIESVSRRDAIKEHGQERVTQAFSALDQAAKTGDPQALAVVQTVKKSMDPFGDIVSWYRGAEAAKDPDAFFQRRLEEALKDEKFKGELMSKLTPTAQSPKSVVKLPPSLGRVPAAQAASDEVGDLSDASLFAHATMRR
jgi:hypothetical protein